MKKTIPKVLIVFTQRRSETSTWFGGFVKRLQKRPGLEGIKIDYVALEDLLFIVRKNVASVYDLRRGEYLDGYTWVYFKRWMSMPVEAAALAVFLRANGIPFADELVLSGINDGKLASQMLFWESNVPIPNTYYCAAHLLDQALSVMRLDYPVVVKDIDGQKGQMNFIAHSEKEVLSIFQSNPAVKFIIQQFIPNKFDYRIQVYGGRAVVAVKRVGKKGSHLNNESAGGASSFIPYDQVPQKVFDLAEEAAAAVGLQVSGVDVLPNLDETKYVILEANQGSQIVTGDTSGDQVAIIDEFNKYVARMAKSRIKQDKRRPTGKLQTVGLHEIVDLPDLDISHAHAKIDTGAYRSSIHATDIKITNRKGRDVLQFKVPTTALKGTVSNLVMHESEDFDTVPVKKSATYIEHRYIVRTRVRIGGRVFKTSFTLTNRGTMRYPILIGRKVLGGRFVVNPALSTKD